MPGMKGTPHDVRVNAIITMVNILIYLFLFFVLRHPKGEGLMKRLTNH